MRPAGRTGASSTPRSGSGPFVDVKTLIPVVWAVDPQLGVTLLVLYSIWRLEDK